MIDEKKIRLMTKTEMVRKKCDRASITAGHFFGSDYVVFQVIKGVFGVVFVFILVMAALFLINAESLLTTYSLDELYDLLKVILLVFLVILLVTVILTVIVYTSRYWRARIELTEYRKCLIRLEKYYSRQKQEQRE